MKILIGSAHAGGGHNTLAKILVSAISLLPENHETKIHYVQGKKAGLYYRMFGLKMFNAFYHKTDNLLGREISLLLVDKLIIREITKVCREKKPDIVFSVFAFYGQTLVHLGVPYITFVADPFSFHSVWADTEAKKMVVFSPEAKSRAKKFLVPEEKIIVSKFPVKKAFFEKYDQADLKEKYGITDKEFVLTIGGSGDGMEKSLAICRFLHKTKLSFKAYVLCGKNIILKTKISARFYLDKRIEAIGFTDNIPEYLKISDLFVGKAGPNILFECLAIATPFLATPPVLGQEEGNREFILKQKIGWVENELRNIVKLIIYLHKNPEKLLEKKERMNIIKNRYIMREEEMLPLIIKLLHSSY